MPDHLWMPASVRAFIRDIVDADLRRTVNLVIIGLIDDPFPSDARVFRVDGEEIEDAYEVDVDLVTIFYTVHGAHVAVQAIHWRVLLTSRGDPPGSARRCSVSRRSSC